MDGSLNGYLVAIREIPGFLLIFVAAALLRLGMARAASLSLLIPASGSPPFPGRIVCPDHHPHARQ